MNAQEKAKELFYKHYDVFKNKYPQDRSASFAKKCALICVDEILQSVPHEPNDVDWDDAGATHQYYYASQRIEAEKYWQQVKNEIEKL